MDNYTIRELPDDASALKHLWCRSGVYYFVRRIPVDVQQHYRSKRVSNSLRTRSLAAAVRAAKSVMQRLDDYWLAFRYGQQRRLLSIPRMIVTWRFLDIVLQFAAILIQPVAHLINGLSRPLAGNMSCIRCATPFGTDSVQRNVLAI